MGRLEGTTPPVLLVVPFSLGSGLLSQAMIDGVALWELEPALLAALLGNALTYLLGGYAVFHLLVRRARKLGVMGHY